MVETEETVQRKEEGEIEIRTKWKTSFWEDDREDREAGRPTQTLSTYWHCMVNVPVCLCVCVRIYANVSSEIILRGLLCPRSVGTSLGFHRYRSPGTRTDRQADGETVDHKGLEQRFSKLLIPNEQHIDSCAQVSPLLQILTQEHPLEGIYFLRRLWLIRTYRLQRDYFVKIADANAMLTRYFKNSVSLSSLYGEALR